MKKDFFGEAFDFRTIPCVCCNKRRYLKECIVKTDSLGICRTCMNELTFSKRGSSFEGSRYVSYILAPLIYDKGARNMIKNLKFFHNTAVAKLIGKILGDFLLEYDHLTDFDMIVPVPLSGKRMNERGYNQAELIAEYVSEYTYIPLENAAVRIKHTRRQSGLNAQKRFYNVQDAFFADDSVKDKSIILVDDVRTTGNTLNNCAKAMVEKGAAQVIGITATMSVPRMIFNY